MKLFAEQLLKGPYYFLKEKNRREFFRLVLSYGAKKRFSTEQVKFNYGNFTVPDALSFIWQYNDIFVEENYKFISEKTSPRILDCGANIGLSLLYFKNLYPGSVITAYEADPLIFKIMAKNIKNNNLSAGIELINKAVWNSSEGVEIKLEGADGASIFSEGEKEKIQSARLKEQLISEKYVDMLKIDIEGAEVEVIKDCAGELHKVENIFIEYHSFAGRNQELDVILKILTDNNFRYFIKPEADRKHPFINRVNKNNPAMDLQLNIFAYKNENTSDK